MQVKYKVIDGEDVPTNLPDIVGLDVETSGGLIHPAHTRLTTVQISPDPGHSYIVTKNFRRLKPILESRTCVGQNLQFDLGQLYHHANINIPKVFDVMVAQGLIGAATTPKSRLRSHNLPSLVKEHLGENRSKEIRGDFAKGRKLTPEMLQYAAVDSSDVLRIREKQLKVLASNQSDNVVKLEMLAVPAFAWIAYNGLKVDKRKWEDNDTKRRARLGKIDLRLSKLLTGSTRKSIFGEEPSVNLNSHAVLKRLLKDNNIDLPNTQRATLEEAYKLYKGDKRSKRILKLLSERSILQKAISTYGLSWTSHLSPITKRVHTTIFQTKPATGRISSADPNITNIPKKPEFRMCFIPQRGYCLIRADYEQQEARIMGYLSNDKKLLEAFHKGIDPYLMVARYMFSNHSLQKDDPERDLAKRIVLGLFYGMGMLKLSHQLGVSLDEAKGYFERFKSEFTGAYQYAEDVIAKAEQVGYAETVAGRRRFADIFSAGFTGEMRNHPVQGTAADMFKASAIHLYREFFDTDVKLVNVIHDETLTEAPLRDAIDVARRVKTLMIDAANLIIPSIPFDVGVKVGSYWGDDSLSSRSIM